MPNLDFKNSFLSIDTPLDKDKKKFFLRSFSGTETMSRIFEFQLELLSADASVNFDDIMGKNINVGVLQSDGTPRIFNGFISRFVQLPGDREGAHYQATMVPWLWFLTRTTDCLIFQDKSVPDIAKEVAKSFGFEKMIDVQVDASKYRVWDYSVQYRETAAHFIMRLLEQEGILFFFNHQKGSHTMVLGDAPSHNKPCPNKSKFRYAPETASGETHSEDVILSWQVEQEIRTGKYTLRDFNFESPRSSLESTVPSRIDQGGNSKFPSYDYPGEYDTKDEGDQYARDRMEEEEMPHNVVQGVGVCRAFASGFRFSVTGNERKDQEGTYVLTSVSHSAFEGAGVTDPGGDGQSYNNNFTCIPVDVPYRPPRTTPRPLMQGSQTAIVVGPDNEEIYCDKYGRVKVQFHWDRVGKKNEKSSCWIRVSQGWAGSNWGSIFIPRIGQEVIVDFLEGDPDQPIITGRVYNADNMPPYELPANQTQSGIKSRSSKEGKSSNFNEVRFEDKKGSEDLLIHAERTMHNSVEANQYITVGGDRHIKTGYIDKDGQEHGDVKELVHDNHNLHVKVDKRALIDGNSSLTVKGDRVEWFASNFTTKVPTGVCFLGAREIQIRALEKITIQAGASTIQIDPSGITIIGVPLVNINPPGMVVPPLLNTDEPTAPDDPD